MDQPWHRYYEEGVPGSLDYPNITLPELLDRSADTYPDRTALRFYVDPKLPPSRLTYRALKERTLRFATALFQLGVRKGDRVGIMLPNCTEFVIAFFGALRLGAIAVNLSPLYVSREMREILVDSGCETLVLLDQFYPRLKEIHAATRLRRAIAVRLDSTLPVTTRAVAQLVQWRHGERVRLPRESHLFFFNELLLEYPASPPGADLKPGDVAVFQYTGGTTGTPKAAMLTHRNLVVNVVQTAAWFHGVERGNEVLLGAIPFFHVYGLTTCMLFGLHEGAEVVLIPRPRPVEHVLTLIKRCRVSFLPGVPTLFNAINSHPDVREYNLSSVRYCISGSAPLPLEVAQTFERLTGGKLVEGFGLTEASPVTHCNPPTGRRKERSIGLPYPDTDARVVDMQTGEPLPPEQEGELVVRGPQVMLGYWNRPEETAQAIREGWLFTGDVARMDEEGYFYIVDRKKDVISVSGFKVLPREVEEVLFLHPKIEEATALGVPDAYQGETVKAFVVVKPGQELTAEEIIEFCRLHLAPYKIPRRVEFRKELPKSLVGKVLRRVLLEEEKGNTPGPVG